MEILPGALLKDTPLKNTALGETGSRTGGKSVFLKMLYFKYEFPAGAKPANILKEKDTNVQ